MRNENNEKMTNIEVMENLMKTMPDGDKRILKDCISTQAFHTNPNKNDRRTIAHGILDAYSRVQDENTKSGLRQLCKKFMNGARAMTGEDSICGKFLEFIME